MCHVIVFKLPFCLINIIFVVDKFLKKKRFVFHSFQFVFFLQCSEFPVEEDSEDEQVEYQMSNGTGVHRRGVKNVKTEWCFTCKGHTSSKRKNVMVKSSRQIGP